MSIDIPSNNAIDILSRQLFTKIKPVCIEISQVALLPTPAFTSQKQRLINLLITLNKALKDSEAIYVLPNNLADYIFFPLSNILKQPQLDDGITLHILDVLSFLLDKSWRFNFQPKLIDQLYPVILYLSGSSLSSMAGRTFEFKKAVIDCLTSLINCIPDSYYSDPQALNRLSLLGNTTSVILDTLESETNKNAVEDLNLTIQLMTLLSEIIKNKITSEQTSQIFPGIISKVVNFFTLSKNLHYSVIIQLLQLLQDLIVKVFTDDELKVELLNNEEVTNLENITQEKSEITISVTGKHTFRTTSWRNATSKQLKLSLVTLLKTLILSSANKTKFQTKPQLVLAVENFTEAILKTCFISLFDIFLSLSIDIYAWLVTLSPKDEEILPLQRFSTIFSNICINNTSHGKLLSSEIQNKLSDLINTKISILVLSFDEDKISSYLISMKLHFVLLFEISKILQPNFELYRTYQIKFLNLLSTTILDRSRSSKNQKQDIITSSNKLDNVVLPPHINSNSLVKFKGAEGQVRNTAYASDMQIISSQWNNQSSMLLKEPVKYFGKFYSKMIEDDIVSLIGLFATFNSKIIDFSHLDFLEEILNIPESEIYDKALILWVANNYTSQLSRVTKNNNLADDLDEYLVLSDDEDNVSDENTESINDLEELSYLVMNKSQDLLGILSNEEMVSYNIKDDNKIESSYAIALDTIGILSNKLDLDSFQADCLIDYLYPMLEALTFQSSPIIQSHAAAAITKVLENFYNNSFEALILDNQDYLIDSISLRLRVSSDLSPTLPGILLIIIKVTGLKLLETNQLADILTEMFVIIDAYHGYSLLVQGFFIIFEELVKQIKAKYVVNGIKEETTTKFSSQKPWGMTSMEELLELVNGSSKIDTAIKYNSNTEYFHRKPDTPFGEQAGDSDDDEDDEEPEQQLEVEKPWKSPVPRSIYFLVQRIFQYGMLLLTHQSSSLKIQIIETMKLVFPILATDYNLTLPIIADLWSLLIALISGSSNLSIFNNPDIDPAMERLIAPSLEFAIEIINQDYKSRDSFLAKRFIEAWDFLLSKSNGFSNRSQNENSKNVKDLVLLKRTISPKLANLYSKFLLTGIRSYEKSISDVTKYNMITTCRVFGIPKDIELSRDVKNILWVLNRN
ncbi:hypothetical protein DFJ63DRAFT_93858 [Scheffersomyces coipomensis]|uniref:uncharacterized protein n=1 Tax=Scheffersomyces coipomensis TaxID=1788519 RepID=UPI00315C7943